MSSAISAFGENITATPIPFFPTDLVHSRQPSPSVDQRILYVRHIITPLSKRSIRIRQTRMLFWRVNSKIKYTRILDDERSGKLVDGEFAL